ncbi:hypothetical protein GEMRC1_003543 [Eukaryota sp. GEM-RC1]
MPIVSSQIMEKICDLNSKVDEINCQSTIGHNDDAILLLLLSKSDYKQIFELIVSQNSLESAQKLFETVLSNTPSIMPIVRSLDMETIYHLLNLLANILPTTSYLDPALKFTSSCLAKVSTNGEVDEELKLMMIAIDHVIDCLDHENVADVKFWLDDLLN